MADVQEAPTAINLKVLSPSAEVQGDINLSDIPASTTVKDLRLRIQNEISTRPATDRMRLIYRGRVVGNESDTLIDVFGEEALRNSKDHTLHLVLRELHPTSTASSPSPPPTQRYSSIAPNPFRNGATPMPPQGMPANPFRVLQPPRPHSQPQGPTQPHVHHSHHHHHHHRPGQQPASISPALNNLLQHPVNQHMGSQNMAGPFAQGQQPRSATPTTSDAGQQQMPAVTLPAGPLPPNSTRSVRTETIGPNGERVTVTWNNTNFTIPTPAFQQPFLPIGFPHPHGYPTPMRLASPAPGATVDQLLARARVGLQTARQEMDNVRVLLHGPDGQESSSTPPVWRLEHIRHHMQSLNQGLEQLQQGLAMLTADPSMANNRDLIHLQQAASGLRGHTLSINAMFDQMRIAAAANEAQASANSRANTTPSSAPSAATSASAPQVQAAGSGSHTNAPDSRPELFLLSSPQGPVGILFDQRGTYSTAPMAPILPMQQFSQLYAANRQLLAGVDQQRTHSALPLHSPIGPGHAPQPTPTQPAANPPAQAQNQNQNQNQNANQPQPAQNPDEAQNDRDLLALWAGHLWLVFKLAVFVYIFAGHGDWYRPILMGIIAAMVYLFQTGMFENQLNQVRQHFEALLPLPQPPNANANAGAQGQAGNVQGAAAPQQQQAGNGSGNGNGNRAPTPEDAARRLLREREQARMGGVREVLQRGERAFALFVASLWPGVGERMVRAQEERVRAVREAEEAERRRVEEERRRAEEEREKKDAEARTEAEPGEGESKGKGKERAVDEGTVEGAAGPSSSPASASASAAA